MPVGAVSLVATTAGSPCCGLDEEDGPLGVPLGLLLGPGWPGSTGVTGCCDGGE